MGETRRLLWADSLKGWLMLLVVIGHAIQSVEKGGCEDNHVWNMIYSFHMPAFMAVSGWLAYAYRGLTATLAVLLLLGLSPTLLDKKQRLNIQAVEFGRISLGVYVVHLLVMGHIVHLIRHALPFASTVAIELLATTIAAAFSCIVVKAIQKNNTISLVLLGKANH